MERSAEMSECGNYRYTLWRSWDSSRPRVVWVMLNPSTADASVDDPTIRKCIAFTNILQCGSMKVLNLFALRSPKPSVLAKHSSPIGILNDSWLSMTCDTPGTKIIVAWGAHGARFRERVLHVMKLIRGETFAFGITKSGDPVHPLMLPYTSRVRPWSVDDLIYQFGGPT